MPKPNEQPEQIIGGDPTDEGLPQPAFPNVGEPEESNPANEGDSSLEEKLAEYQRKLEERDTAMAEERRQWQQTIDKLLQGQTTAQPPKEQAPAAPEGVSFEGLPDPVERPQEYQAELAKRVNDAMQKQAAHMQQLMQQGTQQFSQQMSEKERLDALWEQFKTNYSDLADKQVLLNGAVAAEMQEMKARGLDPMQGIWANPDAFMKSVAGRMKKELGVTDDPGAGRETPPTTPNRTKGLGGGTTTSGAGKGKEKEPPGFLNQLKKAQMDSGLI